MLTFLANVRNYVDQSWSLQNSSKLCNSCFSPNKTTKPRRELQFLSDRCKLWFNLQIDFETQLSNISKSNMYGLRHGGCLLKAFKHTCCSCRVEMEHCLSMLFTLVLGKFLLILGHLHSIKQSIDSFSSEITNLYPSKQASRPPQT